MSLSNKNRVYTTNLSKPRLPYEVESWALNYDKEAENQISIFNEFTDDSYLENLLPFTDGVNHENDNERRIKIREILKNIRSNKSRNKISSKIQPLHYIDDYKVIAGNEKQNEKSTKNDKQKFETISNGMSRAIPGVLQQNITLERTYFNDLIMLSKQRYTTKKSLEYQQKIFQNKQECKGLLNRPIKTTPVIQKASNNKKNIKDKKEEENNFEKNIAKAIRPASVSGFRLTSSTQESLRAHSELDFKQYSYHSNPRNSDIFYNISRENLAEIKNDNESNIQRNIDKPLEDRRYKDFLSSMNECYNTTVKGKEQKLSKSSLRKIINNNECLKDFKYEKFDGTGSNEFEIKKKVFERLASMSELAI